jgi:hypothetical protein
LIQLFISPRHDFVGRFLKKKKKEYINVRCHQ